MTNYCHDSYLMARQLSIKGKEKLKESNSNEKYSFKYDMLAQFIKKI